MNRALTFPLACLLWAASTTGWAMALPIAVAGKVVEMVLVP